MIVCVTTGECATSRNREVRDFPLLCDIHNTLFDQLVVTEMAADVDLLSTTTQLTYATIQLPIKAIKKIWVYT